MSDAMLRVSTTAIGLGVLGLVVLVWRGLEILEDLYRAYRDNKRREGVREKREEI